MHLKKLELHGFKSFAKKSEFLFDVPIVAIVGPNGSGKSNVVEAIRFVLGEQSVKSMRGKTGSDLIFKGSREIQKMSRASVSIIFDNKDRVFHIQNQENSKINLDFDEITITREVFSDGANKYLINGIEVRMKDIHELIASINIGSSGHHIISQGEADRYLNASIKDRRILIEEALGLKVYQYRLKEATRKLEKSEENIRESELLRRELAPHLKFLKRQVDKIEKAKELRLDLKNRYHHYFFNEDFLIKDKQEILGSQKENLENRLVEINNLLPCYTSIEQKTFPEEVEIKEKNKLIEEQQLFISNHVRELGKIEGMMRVFRQQQESLNKEKESQKKVVFTYQQVFSFFKDIVQKLHLLNKDNIHIMVDEIKSDLDIFINNNQEKSIESTNIDHSRSIFELEEKQKTIEQEVTKSQEKIKILQNEILSLEEKLLNLKKEEQNAQKKYYELLAEQKEFFGKQTLVDTQIEGLNERIRRRNEEFTEACILLGEEELVFDNNIFSDSDIFNDEQQELSRREIERIKIRIEDIGGGSGIELVKEYKETKERDEFLKQEIDDITQSIESLQKIIFDLKETLNKEFDNGVEKINKEFDNFFKLMFGGGSACLEPSIIKNRRKNQNISEQNTEDFNDEEQFEEYGIDIKVQLPRKKVSDLDMLSGGERSLTSIALLFALSQVNPPPFLVLDETDAALDEANSQKYGDMIESLSKYSQLIVVTHNRETMSRAQTLFGVTLGRDDSSTTLSLRLEDATQYAK